MTQQDRASADSELDVLIAGVLLVDPLLGVVKTSIGVKDGRIVGIGRAGNPDVTSGVDLTIGPNTLPVMGYGLIATAGGVDSHVHLITPAADPGRARGRGDNADHRRLRGAARRDDRDAARFRAAAGQPRPAGQRQDAGQRPRCGG